MKKSTMKTLMTATSEAAGNEERETPQAFFDALNLKWRFTLDVCATFENAKCKAFYTKADNGLLQSWAGHTVWCNPPYGRVIRLWVAKALAERSKSVIVMLLPARTDTEWFQSLDSHNTLRIEHLPGRLRFGGCVNALGEPTNDPAPFPSILVYF